MITELFSVPIDSSFNLSYLSRADPSENYLNPYFNEVKTFPFIRIYSANNQTVLPGELVATESLIILDSPLIKKVLENAKHVLEFWVKNFGADSFDGKGSDLIITVHYGKNCGVGWNGEQIVIGEENSNHQNNLSLSVIAHEFGHALSQFKLNYKGESGAVNEHFSDVWGALITQYKLNHQAHEASWIIGEDFVTLDNQTYPARSMANPGTAYFSKLEDRDLQPSHYSQRYIGTDDKGGVHINSGILNKAFYLFAIKQGGYAWKIPGQIWYQTLQGKNLNFDCTMAEFAYATLETARIYFPKENQMHHDLLSAWQTVGVL